MDGAEKGAAKGTPPQRSPFCSFHINQSLPQAVSQVRGPNKLCPKQGNPAPHMENLITGRAKEPALLHPSLSRSTTAWAAMPEPSPVKPSPSSVVALTLTCSASIPKAEAMFSAI